MFEIVFVTVKCVMVNLCNDVFVMFGNVETTVIINEIRFAVMLNFVLRCRVLSRLLGCYFFCLFF